MKNYKHPPGFTMVEIMIVVIAVGILSSIALPRYVASSKQGRQNACNANIVNLNQQWELEYINRGLATFPALSEVSHDVRYFPDGPPACPFHTPYEDSNADNRVDPHTH